MRVLTLWSSEYHGGCARRFVELVDGLCTRDSYVTLLSARPFTGRSQPTTERICLPKGRLRAVRNGISFKTRRIVAAAITKHRADLVFAFGLANASLLCPVARDLEIPSVVFVRGMELVLSNNHNLALIKSRVLKNPLKHVYKAVFRAYSRNVLRNTDAIVFQHDAQYRAYVRERMIGRRGHPAIHFLPNNSNPSWMSSVASYEPCSVPRTVIASNLFWNKGFRVAFEAFRRVREDVPEAELKVLGEGPEGAGIREHARSVGGIEFAGHVRDVCSYLRSARVLLHPTLDELGSPNTVLEAARYGIPLIASDEVLHTVAGCSAVYPKHDSAHLAALWIKALRDHTFHAKLCEESRSLAERYSFDWVGEVHAVLLAASRRYDEHR